MLAEAFVRQPERKTVANAPNQAGTKQQTSFSEMGAFGRAYHVKPPAPVAPEGLAK